MSTIDHAAEARHLMSYTFDRGVTDENTEALVNIVGAQVHATLALVEQQRIANIIGLTHVRAQESDFDEGAMLASEALHALIEYEQTLATPFTGPDEVPVIRPDIKKELGLS